MVRLIILAACDLCLCVILSHAFFCVLDISHAPGCENSDLRKRGERSVLVYTPELHIPDDGDLEDYSDAMETDPLVAQYQKVYADDLELRLGLKKRKLPTTLSVSALLNPMFGLEPTIVGSGMMTQEQYNNATSSLLQMMQDIFDSNDPNLNSEGSDSDDEDSRDGVLPVFDNGNHRKAREEYALFCKYKKSKYLPEVGGNFLGLSKEENRDIRVGTKCIKQGEDLPSKRNLAHYVNGKGRFNILRFFRDHQKQFPTLFLVAQCMASRRVVEVGCERFFSLTGYISAPRRTRLGVRTYERLAMLSSNMKRVYVDPTMVKKEYLRRCKLGLWKKANEEEAVRCWNLERLIDAEMNQQPAPKELCLDDLIREAEGEGSNDNDVISID